MTLYDSAADVRHCTQVCIRQMSLQYAKIISRDVAMHCQRILYAFYTEGIGKSSSTS